MLNPLDAILRFLGLRYDPRKAFAEINQDAQIRLSRERMADRLAQMERVDRESTQRLNAAFEGQARAAKRLKTATHKFRTSNPVLEVGGRMLELVRTQNRA